MKGATTMTLDEAWAAAEAALPGYIERNQAAHPDEEWGDPREYTLAVLRHLDGGENGAATAWVYARSTDPTDPEYALAGDYGPTPAAALQALAARLQEKSA